MLLTMPPPHWEEATAPLLVALAVVALSLAMLWPDPDPKKTGLPSASHDTVTTEAAVEEEVAAVEVETEEEPHKPFTIPPLVAEDSSPFQSLVAMDWFLAQTGSFLSLTDLCHVGACSKACRKGVLATKINFLGKPMTMERIMKVPKDLKRLHQNWTQLNSKVLVFGVHGVTQSNNTGVNGQYRYPFPILEFSFEALQLTKSTPGNRHTGGGFGGWRSIRDGSPQIVHNDGWKLTGNPWKELETTNLPPPSLGRVAPMVCVLKGSSKVFYCGGRCFVPPTTENLTRWLDYGEFDAGKSSAAAIFDLSSKTWRLLPPMPQARFRSGIGQIGDRIYIIGGRINAGHHVDGNWHNPIRSILCFDLTREEWIQESIIHDFPGEAYANFAVAAKDERTLLVAGGITSSRMRYDGPSQEVFSLDVTTGLWTQLADLPGSVAQEDCFTGFMLPPKGRCTEPTFAVICGEKWAHLLPNGQWKAIPNNLHQFGLQALRLNTMKKNAIFTGSSWRILPPDNETDEIQFETAGGGVKLPDQGQEMTVYWNRDCTPTVLVVPCN